MASNGLLKIAKNGKCRICYRTRSTTKYVHAVGEVCHGYATGHIWECIDQEECDSVAKKRIAEGHRDSQLIEINMKHGRYKNYVISS